MTLSSTLFARWQSVIATAENAAAQIVAAAPGRLPAQELVHERALDTALQLERELSINGDAAIELMHIALYNERQTAAPLPLSPNWLLVQVALQNLERNAGVRLVGDDLATNPSEPIMTGFFAPQMSLAPFAAGVETVPA